MRIHQTDASLFAVFFSNNKNITLMNTDVRRIVSVIKPFSDAKNLKIAAALYQLTVHSEDAYATVAQIREKSDMLPEKVKECLENELSPFVIEKDGAEGQFRFEGMYMKNLPIISLLDYQAALAEQFECQTAKVIISEQGIVFLEQHICSF